MIGKATGYLLKYSFIPYLSGLIFPYYLVLYLFSLIKIRLRDPYFLFFLAFLCIQLLSLSISVFYSFFSVERGLASFHNIFVFTFLIAGYNAMSNKYISNQIRQNIHYFFYAITFIILLSSIYSFLTEKGVAYGGVLSFIARNKYTVVRFNELYWNFFPNFPRTSVYAIYPNATGLIVISTFILTYTFKEKKSLTEKSLLCLLFIFGVLMTGSRLQLVLGIGILLTLLISNKSWLIFVATLLPVIAILSINIFLFLYTLREGSNNARSNIYLGSLSLMLEVNPIFGLGVKPYMPDYLGVPYPVGSHSSLLGYFVKNGLVGGLFVLSGYIYLFATFFHYLFKLLLTKATLHKKKFLIAVGTLALLLSSLFEDFDAFEPIMYFFGIILYLYRYGTE